MAQSPVSELESESENPELNVEHRMLNTDYEK